MAYETGNNGVNGISGSILLCYFLWKSVLLEGVPLGGYSSNTYGTENFEGGHIGVLYFPKPDAGAPFHFGVVFGGISHSFNVPEAAYSENYAAAQVGVWIFMSQKNFFYIDSKIGMTLGNVSQSIVLPELGFALMF